MRRKEEVLYKILIVMLLSSILLTTLIHNSNHFELNKSININKVTRDNKIYSYDKKILYVSRHDGTISNFRSIANKLSFNVTTLKPSYEIGTEPTCYKEDECKSFVKMLCSQYDYIVIADIIPDSFVYLKHSCNAKIVLEITNRFDLFVSGDDTEYFEQFGKVVTENKNVVVVENNPYETFYACKHKVFIPNYYLIRPVGYAPPEVLRNTFDEVNDEIAVIDHSDQDKDVTIPKLKELNVKHKLLGFRYGGPLVLATYKAVLMLPYQVSIMKMMENFRYGVAMLLPSERLFKELIEDDKYEFAEKDLRNVPDGIKNYVEFYNSEFKDLLVYFDKWEDIPNIIKNTDFDALKLKVKDYMVKYEEKALKLWAQVLDVLPRDDIIKNKTPLCDSSEFYNYEE